MSVKMVASGRTCLKVWYQVGLARLDVCSIEIFDSLFMMVSYFLCLPFLDNFLFLRCYGHKYSIKKAFMLGNQVTFSVMPPFSQTITLEIAHYFNNNNCE